MVQAKNYETMSKFVKVMPRNTMASFFSGHGVDDLFIRKLHPENLLTNLGMYLNR